MTPSAIEFGLLKNGVTTEYESNSLNQYETVGSATCEYDADGNLIRKADGLEVTTYTYDADNRLTRRPIRLPATGCTSTTRSVIVLR